MKILLITATYLPSVNGVAVSVENLKNSLQKSGNQVLVLAPNVKGAKKDKDVLRYPSLNNPFIKDYPIALFPGLKSIYKIITSFKPDIIHVHHPFQIGYFARLLADSFNVPLVFTYHTRYDLYAENYAEFLPKKLKVKFIEKSVDDFCKRVDLIISPSEYLNKFLKKRFGYKNIITIPSALPVFPKINNSKAEFRNELKLPLDKKLLLTVSRLGKEKNVEVLIKSMSYLPSNYQLVVVGTGPDEKRLKKISSQEKLKGKVKFVGKVLHKEIHKYYESADLFYYSSQTETQGLVFLEAMNFGLPIIAVKSPSSEEWVNEKVGVLVENNVDSLSQSVKNLSNKKLLDLSKNAKAYSLGFTEDKITHNLISAYKNLLKSND